MKYKISIGTRHVFTNKTNMATVIDELLRANPRTRLTVSIPMEYHDKVWPAEPTIMGDLDCDHDDPDRFKSEDAEREI